MTPGYKVRPIRALTLAIVAISVALSGCGKNNVSEKDVVAHVNNDVIYRKDLKRDIALRAKNDPQFKLTPESIAGELEEMINRKIMVQYAIEKGLANEERFIATIRSIWENTLIGEVVEYQKKEFHDLIYASDNDINDYYNNMYYKVTFNVFKSLNFDDADEAFDKYIKNKDITGWQAVGPIAYADIESIPLLDAFKMGEGQMGRFSDDSNFYVIEVSKKELLANPGPLESLRDYIEKRVMAIKEKRLFQEWIIERKKNSRIKIKTVNL